MNEVYLIPEWFFIFSVFMELLFSAVTLAVAVFGMVIYKMSNEKNLWRFSLGFLMISISYAAWAAINTHIAHEVRQGILAITLDPIPVHILGVYTYLVFFITGLVTLAFTTLKMENPKTYYLLLGLALTAVVASCSKLITFRIVSLFLITFIAYHYLTEYYFNKNKKAFCILISFILLMLSNIVFMFITTNATTYIFGHLLELGAYSFILFHLIKTLKRK